MTPEEFNDWKKKLSDMYMESIHLSQIQNWTLEEYLSFVSECAAQLDSKWNCSPFSKLCKKRGSNFVFVTLNFDEKILSKEAPLQIVTKITTWKSIQRYAYSFEWRDHEAETGLHCHLVLVGNTSKIMQNAKRLKGPFIELKKEYGTLLKYPMKYLNDKVDYITGKTFEPTKTDHKSKDEALRQKYNLLSVNNIN